MPMECCYGAHMVHIQLYMYPVQICGCFNCDTGVDQVH